MDTQLNVFADFEPKLSEASRDNSVLFLANIQPELQRDVLDQCNPSFVALDSMNLWIDVARDALIDVVRRVDCVILNDAELRQITERPNLVSAANEILEWGPSVVVAKQGEYGAASVTSDSFFAIPAYPLKTVVDPTGAGDTFAGGFVGYLARLRRQRSRAGGVAPCDGLRHRARIVQCRGVRDRAGGATDARRGSRAGGRTASAHAVRAHAGGTCRLKHMLTAVVTELPRPVQQVGPDDRPCDIEPTRIPGRRRWRRPRVLSGVRCRRRGSSARR